MSSSKSKKPKEPILAWKEIVPPHPSTGTPFHSVNSVASSPSMSPLLLPSPLNVSKKNTTRKTLLRTFSRTVKNSPKFAQLLGKLCSSDSGSCITFGKYVKPLKKLFHDFAFFQYALPNMRPIGGVSANGFVYEITYKHHGIRAHTILKCSVPPVKVGGGIDSLYYEYLVGHCFVNQANLKFPCFLETYGAYNIDSSVVQTMATLAQDKSDTFPIKQLKSSTIRRFKPYHNVRDFAQQIRTSCEKQFNIGILIQHISASYSMKSHFDKRYQDKNYYYLELPQLLFQVYAPLSVLGITFTHYDLHRDNVLLYNLGAKKYIQMNYIYPDVTVSFKTHLISKIIDYGRSYFHVDETLNSKVIYKKVCEVCIDRTDPENTCGIYNGYGWLNADSPADNYYIVSSKSNLSHDLRLMNEFKLDPNRLTIPCRITDIFKNLNYETRYGTRERFDAPDERGIIYNIIDATIQLGEMIQKSGYQVENDKFYQHATSVGTLNIYMDASSSKSMTFDPAI